MIIPHLQSTETDHDKKAVGEERAGVCVCVCVCVCEEGGWGGGGVGAQAMQSRHAQAIATLHGVRLFD